MRKLNKKGFTLIELLAVIVILAIIVVVTVPTILNSIDNARLSSIHSLSKEVANWYDNSYAQDKAALSGDKILYGIEITDEWQCLSSLSISNTNAGDKNGKNLAQLYNLSDNDVVLAASEEIIYETKPTATTCSAIRRNPTTGAAEVLLVATSTGKFHVSDVTYALSTAHNGKTYKPTS